MKTHLSVVPRGLLASAFISMALAAPVLRAADAAPVVAKPAVNAPVTITDNGATWTMDNGIVKATIIKANSGIAVARLSRRHHRGPQRVLGANAFRPGHPVTDH